MVQNILFQLLALIANIVTRPWGQARFHTVWVVYDTFRCLPLLPRQVALLDLQGPPKPSPAAAERLQAVHGRVALEVLRPPTVDALEDRLKRAVEEGHSYHVLHFDGHGVLQRGTGAGFTPGTFPHDRYRIHGEGYVIFEKATGSDEAVAAEHFARIVSAGRVPLVVLNA